MSNREEFEKLHWVSVELKSKKLTFNKKINQYACLGGSATLRADPINLAWYAFQEQQEEIARLQSRIDGAMDFYNTAKSDVNIGMMRMAQYLKGADK